MNHSRAWHNANGAVEDARRALADAEKYDQDESWKIDDARDALREAEREFRRIDRDRNLSYDL